MIYGHILLLLLLLPLAGAFFNGLCYPKLADAHSHSPLPGIIASAMIAINFVLSTMLFQNIYVTNLDIIAPIYDWLHIGPLNIDLTLHLDRLSAVMLLIINGIGGLIHIYSIGYMAHEEGASRFFTYLNLFIFSMLLLVLSDNLVFIFAGWEGVGLCSFLLIGYWYETRENTQAAAKAFIVNRIGDVGFVLAMVLLVLKFQNLSVMELSRLFASADTGFLTCVGALLFFAATGKSAQFPLFVWLPDAMAGPTPVSALIHAATMVTAGIYLFARLFGLFTLIPDFMPLVAWVGVLTSLLAGKIAIGQNDVKKVLAYSTVSQLGFMFLALGVGAYDYAVFHVMTHAFFKAALFLSAGALIHACHGEQDMRYMGGLWQTCRGTFIIMALSSAALVGIPLFSGFFSKDGILLATHSYRQGGDMLVILGLASVLLTGIYTARMMVMVFAGSFRGKKKPEATPWLMMLPMAVLASGAVASGYLNVPQWLTPLLPMDRGEVVESTEHFLMATSAAIGILGLMTGWLLFRKNFRLPALPLRSALENKLYIDEIYEYLVVKPVAILGLILARAIETLWTRTLATALSCGTLGLGAILKAQQNGDLQRFMTQLVFGLALAAAAFLWWTRL